MAATARDRASTIVTLVLVVAALLLLALLVLQTINRRDAGGAHGSVGHPSGGTHRRIAYG